MLNTIDDKLIAELAKSIKTEEDLAALSKKLLKLTVEKYPLNNPIYKT